MAQKKPDNYAEMHKTPHNSRQNYAEFGAIILSFAKEVRATDKAGKKTRFTLSAAWLTGPVAAGLDGKVEMYLSSAGKTFKGYEGYCFNDPTVIMSQSSVKLFENVLDSHGKAVKEMTMPSIGDVISA